MIPITDTVTIRVTNVEHPSGRQHDYLRVYGYRVDDLLKRIVEVALPPKVAMDIIQDAQHSPTSPEIEVPRSGWVWPHPLSAIVKTISIQKELDS